MIKFLASEVGYGIISSLIIIFATHFLKKLFKTSTARKRCTPLITLGLGIAASILYYLTIKYGVLNLGEVQAYVTVATFGMEIAVAATGVYIIVKRIFGKNSDEDITLEELFKTADSVLPQGLLLVSNFIGGDIPTAETLYNKVRAEVYTSLNEKKETMDQTISKINILLNGWTNGASVDTFTQAKLLVQSVKTELDMAAKAAEEALKAQEAAAAQKKEKEKKKEKEQQ